MVEFGVPPALNDAVDSIKNAISAGRTDIFRKLLEACETCEGGGVGERKQLVNSFATEDGTFLHMATKLGRGDIVRSLLAAGADPGIFDKNGNTPLQVAPSQYMLSIFMEDLLRATAKSEIGRVCQLIASGISVNAYDNQLSKNTPLHWAASFADLDTINCLIARGANVNLCNSDGATPLHDAVARSSVDLVDVLLEHGANPHIECHKGYKGLTAYRMAQRNTILLPTMKKYTKESCQKQDKFLNGSISPLLSQRQFPTTGSVESLATLEADSHGEVKTSQVAYSTPYSEETRQLLRSESVVSVGADSLINSSVNGKIDNLHSMRTQLDSTSSLELAPSMEQVCEKLSSVHLSTPPRPLVTNAALHNLWPQPKRITELGGSSWKVPTVGTLAVSSGPILVHDVLDVWNIHKPSLKEAGCDIHLGFVIGPLQYDCNRADINCTVNPSLMISEAHYNLTVEEDGVKITCGSLSSLHHAIITFLQLLRVFSVEEEIGDYQGLNLPPLVILDFPSVPNRGFLLDVSPMARIPKLEQICHIVDSLLSMKINQLHLIFKITFSTKLPLRMSPTSKKPLDVECCCHLPYSPSELVSLERYCSDRGICLVPGFELDLESSVSLNHSLPDISRVMSEALVNLPSARYVHIGPVLTSFIADAGNSMVWPWNQLHIPVNATLMVCANVFHSNKKSFQKLPLTSILVEYGFQADYDFSKGCRFAAEKGRSLGICAGTAAWASLSGWPEAGVSNVYSGIVSSFESGASCVLVAHWSNTACLTPFIFAWPPLLVAAGLSWNHTTHWDFVHSSVGSLMDRHLFKIPNCGIGTAIIEMGRCETWLTRSARDQSPTDASDLPSCAGSTLHQFLADPDGVIVDNLTPEVFCSIMRQVRKSVRDGVSCKKDQQSVGLTEVATISKWPLAQLSVLELHLTVDMILTACRLGRSIVTFGTNPRSNMGMAVINLGVANLPPTFRTDLANKILALREVYSSVWLQGYQPNGLQYSLLIFSSLLSRLLPEQIIHRI